MNEKFRTCFFAFVVGLVVGCLCGWVRCNLLIAGSTGELNSKHAVELRRTEEIVGELGAELGRERQLNIQLQEHNSRARELTAGLRDTTERNIRNLQDAIGLIGEIRAKLKVLEDFYADRNSGGGSN